MPSPCRRFVHDGKFPRLEPLEWCLLDGWIYFRVRDKTSCRNRTTCPAAATGRHHAVRRARRDRQRPGRPRLSARRRQLPRHGPPIGPGGSDLHRKRPQRDQHRRRVPRAGRYMHRCAATARHSSASKATASCKRSATCSTPHAAHEAAIVREGGNDYRGEIDRNPCSASATSKSPRPPTSCITRAAKFAAKGRGCRSSTSPRRPRSCWCRWRAPTCRSCSTK